MRLGEMFFNLVHSTQIKFIRKLIKSHPDYFSNDDQKVRLRTFADNHEARNRAGKKDRLVEDILRVPPIRKFRSPDAMDFILNSKDLSAAIKANEAFYSAHDTYDPDAVRQVNHLAAGLGRFHDGLTLSDLDEPGGKAVKVYFRDLGNLIARTWGKTHHESRWRSGKWENWNRDIAVYPQGYEKPDSLAALSSILSDPAPARAVRIVAGGHGFNASYGMGGKKKTPRGVLVTLDEYTLAGGKTWEPVDPNQAVDTYHLSSEEAQRVVRASAGIRLRVFGALMREAGMTLPVAGSTDAQSLGGLVATDLHSTGRAAGFLSQQLLEVTVLDAKGNTVVFKKDESVPRGVPGRWTWTPPGGGAPEGLGRLPVSGAIGTAGIVVEVVLKLDPAFNMRKAQQFVPREWSEKNIDELLKVGQQQDLFDYDHVSFYYAGGLGPGLPTVRMNSWKRTGDEVTQRSEHLKTQNEILDHLGSAFLPGYLQRLSERRSPTPGQPEAPEDDEWLIFLNGRRPVVFPSNEAFARKLFFQHDEIEVGIPLPVNGGKVDYDTFRSAIRDTQELLAEQEFNTVIEVRFTPDVSEAMIGPGTGGPTCYIELATPLREYSKGRIVSVYQLFEDKMRGKYKARPHLGKKTTVTHAQMDALYGDVWREFQEVQRAMDPTGRFLPEENKLLSRIFRPPVPAAAASG